MSDKILVLTIIAGPPEGFTLEAGSPLATSDGNVGIEELVESLTRKAQVVNADPEAKHEVRLYRAPYVVHIGLAIKKVTEEAHRPPDIIQIIGHGSSGRLELGAYWTKKTSHPKLGYAILDSNPFAYGVLSKSIPEGSSVLLLGCGVGSNDITGFIANGKTLLFDLEEMSKANIYAAPDTVSPQDFGDSGLFTGPLVGSTGKPANPTALPRSTKLRPGTVVSVPPTTFTFHQVNAAPALTASVEFEGPPSDVTVFDGTYEVASELQDKKLLAMTELALAHTVEGYGPAEFILGLRYLRVQDSQGKTLYFKKTGSESDAGRDRKREELAKLADQLASAGGSTEASSVL